jgi:hypothetical protein
MLHGQNLSSPQVNLSLLRRNFLNDLLPQQTPPPPSNARQLISYRHILIIILSKVSAIDRNIHLYRLGLKEYHYSKVRESPEFRNIQLSKMLTF